MSNRCELYHGDCLSVMPTLTDNNIALVLTDLPYGVLNKKNPNAKWDSIIPMERLWEEWDRICKPDAAYVLFGSGMFTAHLMMSNPSLWRYNLIWDKCRASGFLNSKRMPLRSHEDICIFYKQVPIYNPQLVKAGKGEESHSKGRVDKGFKNSCYGDFKIVKDGDLSLKYPKSIIKIQRDPPTAVVHPTQKPVDLCRWLIRTYTNPGDVVMDSTMGSGTTGVAAVLEGRGFIGIEKERKYFEIANERILESIEQPKQDTLF